MPGPRRAACGSPGKGPGRHSEDLASAGVTVTDSRGNFDGTPAASLNHTTTTARSHCFTAVDPGSSIWKVGMCYIT